MILSGWNGWKNSKNEEGWATDVHKPEKDETDTDLAVRSALRAGFHTAHVLGATGGRLDHELSNIHLMRAAKDAGLFMEIYDAKNPYLSPNTG